MKIRVVTVCLLILCHSSFIFAEGQEELSAQDEEMYSQVEKLKENYLLLSERLTQLQIENKRLLANEKNLNDRIESSLQSLSEVTMDNQSLKNELSKIKNTECIGSDASNSKVEELEEVIQILKLKLQKIEKLINKP